MVLARRLDKLAVIGLELGLHPAVLPAICTRERGGKRRACVSESERERQKHRGSVCEREREEKKRREREKKEWKKKREKRKTRSAPTKRK